MGHVGYTHNLKKFKVEGQNKKDQKNYLISQNKLKKQAHFQLF